MKKIILLTLVASISLAGLACVPFGSIVGRGPVETHTQDFSGFTQLEISSTFDVEVVRDSAYSVSVTTNQNIFDYLDISKDGDTLKIRLKNGSYTVASLKARVTMPELVSLEVNGASHATMSGFTTSQAMKFTASGASTLTGDIACKQVKLEAGAASHFELSGSADTADIELTAASNANLEKMIVGDARIKLGGAASMTIDVRGKLDANVSGASNLRWLGTPTLGDVKITGASSFSKKS